MSVMVPLPEPEVLIKKIKGKHHGVHHGGAWKVAYADFVTAMMAFFMLMWLLSTTDNEKRKGLAEYFAPTLNISDTGAGSNGLLQGQSLIAPDGEMPHDQQSKFEPVQSYHSGKDALAKVQAMEKAQLKAIEHQVRQRIEQDKGLAKLQEVIKFTHTPEGLRIELIDKADYSMFALGTATMDPRSRQLLTVVAEAIAHMPQKLAIRGHTDSHPYVGGLQGSRNNWNLSSDRAESTRVELAKAGIPNQRFSRLEGVADTQPHVPSDPADPRNRRMSITLLRNG